VKVWVIATTIGWTACAAAEIFGQQTLTPVNRLAGRLVSAIAGYTVASTMGATLLGGAVAGTITGVALAFIASARPFR
jgi:hypothetical protein